MVSGKVLDLSASASPSLRALGLQGPSEGSDQICRDEEGGPPGIRAEAGSPEYHTVGSVHLPEDT